MKKRAVKGLIALVIVAGLCVFFSGTLHTITTAKVRFANARTGRFETTITMTGELQWPETKMLQAEGMRSEDTLIVREVPVSVGSWVNEGDLIAACELSDFESRLSTLQDSYDSKEKEYLELERKNSGLVLTEQQQEWLAVYEQLEKAMNTTQTLRQDLRVEAWKAGITLEEGDLLPEGTEGEALLAAREALSAAEKEETAIRERFDQMKRLGMSEDLMTYLNQKKNLEKELEKLTGEMTDLRVMREKAQAIRAPWAGYVTVMELKPGDQVSRTTTVATLTAADTVPVIRLNPGENRKTVAVGSRVKLTVGDAMLETEISGQGVRAEGGLYLDVALKRGEIASLGGVAALTAQDAVTGEIRWQAETASTLIPSSALRGTESDRFVFVVQTALNALGGETKTVQRKNVTVLGISGAVASVSENLQNNTLAYMEDRTLTEGCEVMGYE